ncbi:MAG: response regulator [Desulfonatronovibrio sp.]
MIHSQKKAVPIIEDDPHTTELVALYLKQEGFAPLKAGDGEEALDMAERHKPVLIILDLMIPKIDGW